MKIGLTGATGALGHRIAEASKASGMDVRPFAGDVRSTEDLRNWAQGLDAIIHSAAVVPTKDVVEHLSDAIAINVAGTANVSQVARDAGCRLVYISTSHVYQSSDQPIAEDGAIAPISPYGLTKLQGEQWARWFCPDVLILRVFSFFDARQAGSFLIPALITRIATAEQGAQLDLFGGESRRDMADAGWLGLVCTQLIRQGATGIVNCASGRRDSVLEIAQETASALGRSDIRWNVIQDRPADYLLADTTRLKSLVADLPPFDLSASLVRAHRDFAPRSGDALTHRFGG